MAVGVYDPKTIEPEVMKFWEREQIYDKARAKNKDKTPFYFLQGPPYTSGKLHIGHAWNSAMKDMVLRYKRMCGFDVWDRAGYDMHGLPTEMKVQKELNLKDKDAIIAYGIDKFIKRCIEFSTDNAQSMDKDLWRMGVWMDYDNAYYPIKNSYMENEWWLIKRAHEEGRLYKGKLTMTWCRHCETGLAKHELEYDTVKDNSVFLKFPVAGKKNEFLIIWTTTPWTIPFNMAVMANPDLDYLRAQVDEEVWIVAEALSTAVIGAVAGKQFKVLEKFKGEKLKDLKYTHPLENEIPYFKEIAQKTPKLHTVVLSSKYVDASAGSGLVHCAPGCGPEDYEVGRENHLPPFNRLNERGEFQDMGKYTGWVAKKDDKKFIEEFKEKGALIEVTPVEHEYAHCWRCHNPVIFRATEQWFFKIEDLKPKLLEWNEKVHTWSPEWGKSAYANWVENLKDNSITRQRFWGAPVPIWECGKCKEVIVVGSTAELKKLAGKELPPDLHRPWIDYFTITCPKCGDTEVKRIPDVIDVWIDSGTLSWNCLDYPNQRKDLFEKLYPAEFVLEANEQIRLWFSMLNICSAIALDRPAFKNVFMTGMILDWKGKKMSKSQGNIVSPYEVIDKYSADLMRIYLSEAPAGERISFKFEEVEIKRRNLMILWNLHKFLLELVSQTGKNPADFDPKVIESLFANEEKYIMSKLNSMMKAMTEKYEKYDLDSIPAMTEELFLALSRTYIQLVRDKAAIGTDNDKEVVLYTLYKVMLETLKLHAPVAPFVTEQMYQNMKTALKLPEESIHLCDWPKVDEKKIDSTLEEQMQVTGKVIESALAAREKAKLSVRWPLKAITVVTDNNVVKKAVEELKEIIKTQVNTKEVVVAAKADGEAVEFKDGKVVLDVTRTPELDGEGYAREIMRKIQALRKQAKLDKRDEINVVLQVESEFAKMLSSWESAIKEKIGAKTLKFSEQAPAKKHEVSQEEKVKEKKFSIHFDKA